MTTQLALPLAKFRKNYYVEFYLGDHSHNNRVLFTPFYGRDYPTELDAKKASIKYFLNHRGEAGFYDSVRLIECNGMQIADSNEPYRSKSAIVSIIAKKEVKY